MRSNHYLSSTVEVGFEESGFVYDQHRIVGGERLHHLITRNVAKRIRSPPATVEDCLLPPRSRITGRLSAHPPGLASLGLVVPRCNTEGRTLNLA